MANEYQLKLKAILDSSQIKNEIANIQKQLGINAPTSLAGGKQTYTNNALGKSDGLNGVFQRLNSSINQLNTTIKQLITTGGVSGGTRSIKSQPVQAPIAYTSSGGIVAKKVKDQFEKNADQAFLTNIKKYMSVQDNIKIAGGGKIKQALFDLMKGDYADVKKVGTGFDKYNRVVSSVYGSDPIANNFKSGSIFGSRQNFLNLQEYYKKNARIGDFENPSDFKNFIKSVDLKNITNDDDLTKTFNKRLFRGMTTMFAGQLMGSYANFVQAQSPDTDKKSYVEVGQNIAQSTATGLMMGGGVGAVVGAGVGVASSAINFFAERIQKASESAKNFSDTLLSVRKFEQTQSDFGNQQQFRTAQRAGDIEAIQRLLSKAKIEKTALQNINSEVDGEGGLRKYEQRTRQLQLQKESTYNPSLQESLQREIDARNQTSKEYQQNAQRIMQLQSSINTYDDAIKEQIKILRVRGYESGLITNEGRLNRADDVLTEQDRKYARTRYRKEQEKYLKIISNPNSTQDQIDEAQDKLSYFKSRMAQAEAERNMRRGIVSQANSILGGYDQRTRTNSVQDMIYSLNQAGAGEQYKLQEFKNSLFSTSKSRKSAEENAIKYAKMAKDDSLSADDRKDALEKAQYYEKEARKYDGEIGEWKSAIQGLNLDIYKPDMSNVQSLAQLGFGMGEKNDNQQRMESFWRDSINLQQEIRNILNDRTIEATYSGDVNQM